MRVAEKAKLKEKNGNFKLLQNGKGRNLFSKCLAKLQQNKLIIVSLNY